MNGYKISRQVLGAILMTLLLVGCTTPATPPSPFPGPTPSPLAAVTGTTTETVELFLGRGKNRPRIDQRLFTGSDVTQFSLNLAITPAWPTGLLVELFDETGSIKEYDAPPATAPVITGNSVRIVVTTRGNAWVTLDGNGSKLHIRDLTVLSTTTAPATPPPAQRLELGVETVGYTGAGTLLFFIDVDPTPGEIYSLYLSPFAPTSTPAHNINARLGWALGAATQVPVEFNMLDPYTSSSRGADTGIYHEMNVADKGRLYLVVAADPDRFFRLTVQRVHSLLELVVELDGGLDGIAAPVITPTTHSGTGVWADYITSVHEFIRDTSNYNDRGREVLVMGSAGLLAATEGYFRFHKIRYHYGADPLRDVDIIFDVYCGRARAMWHLWPLEPLDDITLWRDHTQDPIEGASVLVHEWGHYHWSMPDDYIENVGVICLNSVMGDHTNTFEFCGAQSHFTGTGADTIGVNCSWSFITAQDGVRPPRPDTDTSPEVSYPQNQANYLDVLHKLEDMMLIDPDPQPLARSGNYPICSDVGAGAKVGINGTFGVTNTYGAGSLIGNEADIGDDNTFGAESLIGNNVTCGDNNTFGAGSQVGNNVTIGDDVTIEEGAQVGNNVDIHDGATIKAGAQVGNDVLIGRNVTVHNAVIQNNVTIGDGATVRAGANVGDSANIHAGVTIGARQVVPPNTVVCCSCTGNLYDCADFDMWPDAYCCYLGCQAITGSDVHNMDGNNNGMPCEP
jgi:carbonic anhydrase/acetyltransferase-like protein (isoleucine patch superfamily)